MPLKSRLIVLLAMLSVVGMLFAADETIYDIRVVGNHNIESSLILSAIPVHVGDVLDPEETAKAIKQLNSLSVFKQVDISSEPYRNGINLIITVEEYPVVYDVKFTGFNAIKKERIDELISLRKGSYWSGQLENQVVRKLEKEYVTKGYQNARVNVITTPMEDNRVKLNVVADEGRRVAVRQIEFIGVTQMEPKKLLRRMKTKPASLLRSGRFDQDVFEKDLQTLITFYQKNGYIDARVVDWKLEPLNEKSQSLQITIEEGQKYKFGSLTVSGNTQFTEKAILSKFHLKSGEPFDQEKFDKQMADVYSLYFEEGYIYASIEPEQIKAGDLLNINLQITENTRAKVREIQIAGNRRTKEKVLRRQLEIAPGDYYRQSQVMLSRQNIYNLGYFDQDISMDYTPINANGDIDLKMGVTDKQSGSANGGVGYNSQDKLVGTLSVSENNLFGNNWTASVKWEFGSSTQNFEFDFTNPNLYDTDMLLGFNVYNTRKKWTTYFYEINTQGASVRVGEPIPLVNRSRFVLGYSLYAKKYHITDMSEVLQNPTANANLIELDSLGTQWTSSTNFTLSRDTRDNVFFPTTGSQMTVYSELAGGPLGGDFDYFKQIAQVNWYIETWKKITLRNKWRFGYVAPFGNTSAVPPDERFYLGGTGPDGVRGWADRSIGPVGGGTREIIFSSEVGYPLGGDQVVLLGFFDAGNSYNKLRDFNFLDFKKGVGAGVRIRSPFGLIGFDYAYNPEKNTWEPHLQFGTTF